MFTIILNFIDSTSSTSISTTTPSTIPPSDSCFKNCFDVSTRVFKNFIIKFSNGQLFSKMVKGGFMDFYPLNNSFPLVCKLKNHMESFVEKIWYSIQQYLTPTFTKILILSWMFFKSHDTFKKKFQLFFVQLGVVYCCWVLFAVLKKNITLNTTLNPTNLDTLFMTYLYKYHRAICIQNHSKSLW